MHGLKNFKWRPLVTTRRPAGSETLRYDIIPETDFGKH